MPRLSLTVTVLALLTACQPGITPLPADGAVFPAGRPVISGVVQMPGWTTQATSAQVVNQALVTLVDANGITRAGGTTTAAGAFTLYPVASVFSAADGSFFTLNVSRRLASGPVLSLRTTVKLVGTGWNSITGTTVAVNLTTTAITDIDAEDAAVTPELTMGKVSGGGFTTVAAIGAWTPARIGSRVTTYTTQLTAGRNPGPSPARAYTGDVTITDANSVTNLTGFTTITGNLTFNAAALTAVELPNLTAVTGNVTIASQTNLATLNLPVLKTVGGSLAITGNPALTSLSGLASLVSVGTSLTIDNNGNLATLGMPAFITCPTNFTVTNNAALSLSGQITPLLSQLTAAPGGTTTTGNAV